MTDQTPKARLAAALSMHDPSTDPGYFCDDLCDHAADARVILAADPTLVCPDPAAHEGVTFTEYSLARAHARLTGHDGACSSPYGRCASWDAVHATIKAAKEEA